MRPQASAEAIIDLAAYRHNLELIKATASSAQVMAVLKADAYGHGAHECARVLSEVNVSWVGVATPDEALALRQSQRVPRMLCWLTTPADDLRPAIEQDIDLTASTTEELDQIGRAAALAGTRARVHLKVDTGMNRNGADPGLWAALIEDGLALQRAGRVELVGAWSHLACADDPDDPRTTTQANAFELAVDQARSLGFDPELTHLANSAAALTRPDTHHDLVRVGLASYGLDPVPSVVHDDLRPVMTLRAVISQVKRVEAGQYISYGDGRRTAAPTTVALLPVGYGDGIPRALSGRGTAALAGHTHQFAGRVCMDQTMLDIGDVTASRGDVVTLFGSGAEDVPTAQEWAETAGTISYEIVTRLGGRIRRRYVDRG